MWSGCTEPVVQVYRATPTILADLTTRSGVLGHARLAKSGCHSTCILRKPSRTLIGKQFETGIARFPSSCPADDSSTDNGWVTQEMSMAVAILLLRIMAEPHDGR